MAKRGDGRPTAAANRLDATRNKARELQRNVDWLRVVTEHSWTAWVLMGDCSGT